MATIPLPLGYSRLDPFPLDNTSIFSSYANLTAYAANIPTAYAGQICSVTATNKAYVIKGNKTVQELGSDVGGLYLPLSGGTVSNTLVANNLVISNVSANGSMSFTVNEADPSFAIIDNPNGLNPIEYSNDAQKLLTLRSGEDIVLEPAQTGSGEVKVNGDINVSGFVFGKAPDSQLNINSTQAVQNSAVTAALQLLSPAPTYNPPSATLTQFSTTNVEIGQTVLQTLTMSWTPGDAGAQGAWRLNKNGSSVASGTNALPQNYSVNEVAVLGTTTYALSVNYSQGLIKNNILGFPDSRGQILAGAVSSLNRQYNVYYRYFYGSVATIPSNLRDLPFSVLGNVNSFTFTAGENNIVVAVPSSKVIQSAITQTLEDITTNFILSSVSINDAAGVSQSYKRYVVTSAIPLGIPLTVTIGNA